MTSPTHSTEEFLTSSTSLPPTSTSSSITSTTSNSLLTKTKQKFCYNKYKAFSTWYLKLLEFSGLVDNKYPLKGVFVWKPDGYFIFKRLWKCFVEDAFEDLQYRETQFPLLIPHSLIKKQICGEATLMHPMEQFYWITKSGSVELGDPLAVRNSSEVVIYESLSKWIQTNRDLPYRIYQNCQIYQPDVIGTHPLLKSREMFWSEAHSCHISEEDALVEMNHLWYSMLRCFREELGLCNGMRLRRMKMDTKPGAEYTDCWDYVMPNGKVIQVAASHYFSNQLSKQYGIHILQHNSNTGHHEKHYLFNTCFGISLRLMAILIAEHGDERGLILPPKLAPTQIVIIPIYGKEKSNDSIYAYCDKWNKIFGQNHWRVTLDNGDKRPGEKFYYWEMKGAYLRIEIGNKEMENKFISLTRRGQKKKQIIEEDQVISTLNMMLNESNTRFWEKEVEEIGTTQTSTAKKSQISNDPLRKDIPSSQSFPKTKIKTVFSLGDLCKLLEKEGGFVRIPIHEGSYTEVAQKIYQVTEGGDIRGYSPLDSSNDLQLHQNQETVKCIITGKTATRFVYVAKPYI